MFRSKFVIMPMLIFLSVIYSSSMLAQQPQNPYDFVGQWHNQTLNYVASNLSILGDDRFFWPITTSQMVGDHVCIQMQEGGKTVRPNCEVRTMGYANVVLSWVAPLLIDDQNKQAEVIGQLLDTLKSLNTSQKDLLKAVFEAIPNTPVEIDLAFATLDSIDAKAMKIRPAREARIILIASAVARHSMSYWAEQLNAERSSPWFRDDSASKLCWKCVGAADVGGAVFGGVGGALFGGIGVVGGAVAGGAIASAGWLLAEIF